MNNIFNFLVDKSKFFIFLLFALSIISIIGLPRFQLDASSDTLLLDNDPDLKIYRENSENFDEVILVLLRLRPISTFFQMRQIKV